MAQRARRPLLILSFVILTPVLALDRNAHPGWLGRQADRVVFLGGNLTDEQTITFTAALAASGHPGVFLLDSPRSRQYTQAFLREFGPRWVVPVGSFNESRDDLENRFQAECAPIQPWTGGPPDGLWQLLLPRARRLVLAPARPRRILLQAACLAGVLRAPLLVCRDSSDDATNLKHCLERWDIRDIYSVGETNTLCGPEIKARVHHLPDEAAVFSAGLKHHAKPIRTVVVANPADARLGGMGMSTLTPWIALQRGCPLLLTSDDGTNVEELVENVVLLSALKNVDNLVLAGDLHAIPMLRRPNPLPGGKDAFIEMEPLTPAGSQPFSYAVGRLFHEDLNVVALMLARPRLWEINPASAGKAILVSNPGGGLPLLETVSRNTAQELNNAGYDTTALFGSRASEAILRRLLPQQTIFLWEGHHSTLIREYEVPQWTEPLRPSLVFLQSCLALTEEKAQPFLRKGAVGVIGSSTRTYSGSGAAFALAYFNALLYDQQNVGGSLRHAKNFMLAFSMLKEKRLAGKARLRGANTRTAWAFTLWGDPTLALPHPIPPREHLPRVRAEVRGNTIRIAMPGAQHEKSASGQYQAQIWANARLGGLLKIHDDDNRQLTPLVFAEVFLPAAHGKTPRFTSRLAGKKWVACWDPRRSCAYLLAVPGSVAQNSPASSAGSDRQADQSAAQELRFHVSWN